MKYLRLKESYLFSGAYSAGKKAVCKRIVVYALPDKRAEKYKRINPENEKVNRVGYTVSRKYGHAFERNRAKRIMREAYYKLIKENDVLRGYIIVICARGALKGVKMQEAYSDLLFAASKLEIIKK